MVTNSFLQRNPSTDALEAAKARIRAHPDLRDAVMLSAAGSIAAHQSDPALHTTQKDGGRFLFTMLSMHVHYTDGYLSAGRITALCEQLNLCSPGRTAAMLGQMEHAGYLTRDPEDRRRMVLARAAIVAVRERIRSELHAISMVAPEVAPALTALDDERVFGRMMQETGLIFIERGLFFVHKDSPAQAFTQRDCGMLILFTIMLSGSPDDDIPPTMAVPVSIAKIADQFGVSRAHVRKLLTDSETLGLLEREQGERAVRLTPVLREAALDFFATMFAVLRRAALTAAP